MTRWRQANFAEVIQSRGAGTSGLPQGEWALAGKYPVIGQGAEFIEGWTDREDLVIQPNPAVVLYGGHTRRAKFVDRPFVPGPNVKILEPVLDLDGAFLFRYLEQLKVESRGYADHFPEVRRRRVPVPPLPEQRRIAEILDKADALRDKRRAALAQLDILTQSIFLDMFGDPATNPKGWVQKCAGRLGTVTTGNTPPRDDPRNYGDAIEWIKSDNLSTSDYYATKASEYLSEAGMAQARVAPAGAILITCIAGSPSSIGNAAMIDRAVAFNQQINAFVPEHGNPHFFFAQLTVGKRLVQQASTGGMKGMVSKGRFEKILLLDPPPDLQDRFSELASRIEGTKSGLHASLAQTEALFASLQHRAFRGEL